MAGGVWWHDGTSDSGGPGESVYVPEQPAAPAPPPTAPPTAPAEAAAKPVPPSKADRPEETGTGVGRAIARAAGGGPTVVTDAYPGWDRVEFDFGAERAARELPDQRTAAGPDPAEPQPGAEPEGDGAATAPGAPAALGLLAGRRPSPLLLLAALLLLGGSATGQLLVMLLGWGAAYLSRKIGEFTRKFVVLGVPLITMTVSSFWYWGRTQGRWGDPVSPGAQVGQAAWQAAPGVLRVAAVVSALVLLVLTLRRRPAPAKG
ncbi:hypothetical protein [Kitasatospora camelliae]|uniref:Integral membrane protein n=1 Tax=Kitasatospora camelliae TaxID=3156397 RepID=A0AAU8JYQ9_9ACTN